MKALVRGYGWYYRQLIFSLTTEEFVVKRYITNWL